MAKICEYVDVCIANEEDAADVFGIKASDTDVTSGEVNREGYKEVASESMPISTTGQLCCMMEKITISQRDTTCRL